MLFKASCNFDTMAKICTDVSVLLAMTHSSNSKGTPKNRTELSKTSAIYVNRHTLRFTRPHKKAVRSKSIPLRHRHPFDAGYGVAA